MVAAGSLATWHAVSLPPIVVDDAFISYRYAWNLVAGHGLVFNIDEYVEGYSNFLWVLLTAGALRSGLDPVFFTRVLGWIALVGTVCTAIGLAWRVTRSRLAAATVGLWLASSTALCASAVLGLETAGFGVLILAGATLFIRRRPMLASIAFGLAALTRPEGFALWLLALFVQALEGRRARKSDWLRLVGPCLAMLAGLLAFRLSYYGSWTPNSVVAKAALLTRLAAEDWTGWAGVVFNRAGLEYIERFVFATVGPLAIVALVPLLRPNGRRRAARYLSGAVALGFSVALYNHGDWMTAFRLLTPYQAMLTVLVVWGATSILRGRLVRPRPVLAGGLRVGLVSLVLMAVSLGWQREMPERGLPPDRELAALLRYSNQPGLLAATDVLGRLGYYAPEVPIVDMAGLTDAYIARYGRPKPTFGKWDLDYTLSRRPHLIMTNTLNSWRDDLPRADLNADYICLIDPSWRPARYVFVRKGSVIERELAWAYPDARRLAPRELTDERVARGAAAPSPGHRPTQ